MPSEALPVPAGISSPDSLPSGIHRDLYSLWLGKCAPGQLPGRADFDPREMPRLLPFVTLIDVERDPLRFRIRLVGTAVVAATGLDMTGRYLEEMNQIEPALERCRHLVETAYPYFHTDLPLVWSSHNFKSYSVLSLPLAADGLAVDKILMSLQFE